MEYHSIFDLQVKPSDTIIELKRQIQEKVDIRAEEQRLYYAGEQLEDGRTLFDCNIETSSTVQLQRKEGKQLSICLRTSLGASFSVNILSMFL